ncbi:MAG TPA: hypothetical protein VFZ73_15275 [Gemmatimonadaceae bacterium]
MGLKLTRQRTLLALALGSLLAVPATAFGQESGKEEKGPKEPPTPEKIAEWKKEAEGRALFTADTPVELTLVGNYKVIAKDRDTLSTTEYWGEVRMKDGNGADLKIPVQLRTRGHYRLANRNCSFVPLRLDFKKGDVKGTVFDGQDKLKLITHCRSNDQYDEYMVREYLAYKVHNLITPRSYRARMAKVTYVDSATGNPIETRNGVFLEHEDDVARRMEGEIVEIRRALFDDVDQNQILELAIFAAFIGHVDWSLAALHNVRLVKQQNGNFMPVLYDMDFTGLVSTKYSIPDPRLGIRSVKDRLYRGPCKMPEELAAFFTPYRENKDAILKLYDDTPGLDNRYRNDAKNWLTQWFKLLESPRDAKWMFKDNCVVAPGV